MNHDDLGLSWRRQAACAGFPTGWFFPRSGPPSETTTRARRLCAGCPVRGACLEHALDAPEELGIWGGTTGNERAAMRRARRARPAA